MSNHNYLAELLSNTEWVIGTKVGARAGSVDGKKLYIRLMKSSSKALYADRLNVIVGNVLAEALGWRKGDKINLFHHPSSPKACMLTKTVNGNKLLPMSSSIHYQIGFTLSPELRALKLPAMPSSLPIESLPNGNKIVFILDSMGNAL